MSNKHTSLLSGLFSLLFVLGMTSVLGTAYFGGNTVLVISEFVISVFFGAYAVYLSNNTKKNKLNEKSGVSDMGSKKAPL